MATKEQIARGHEILKQKWDSEGSCDSCGWHACLYEHYVDDADIIDAIDNNEGVLMLSCKNYEDGDPVGHRGVKINIVA